MKEMKTLTIGDVTYEIVDETARRALAAGYVSAYGAKGDGVADDTEAFKNALENNRVVIVPGGTYKLTSGITIGDNCCLELAQDAVLNFTNTTGNCITLGMLSNLKGNHATINVPYEFEGNVLYAYSNTHTEAHQKLVPPFSHWDPMWKTARYVTDINICKADSRGLECAVNPEDCKGTAVYISAKYTAGMSTFMWGLHYSGLRIAGAFAYGIYGLNINSGTHKGWTNDMRIDAIIDACEIGVQLENCNQAYISAIVQPRCAFTIDERYIPFAKHGIKLIGCINVDLSGSRVWDWNADNALWTEDGEYQSYAMIGDCRGAIINDFAYHLSGDTRKRIYTDRIDNFDRMTILQEPIDTFFKTKNGEPYFFDGLANQRLVTKNELENHFDTDFVLKFTDVLPTATDDNGEVLDGVGYAKGYLTPEGTVEYSDYYVYTGYIPWERGQKLHTHDMVRSSKDGFFRFCLYDADKNLVKFVPGASLGEDGYAISITDKDNGFIATLNSVVATENTAFVRISMYSGSMGDMPMVAIDEPIEYTVEGFLADGVKVKGENVIGEIGVDPPDWEARMTITEGAAVWGEKKIKFTNNTAYFSENGGNFNVNIGVPYDVYWNGTLYQCVAKSRNDEPYIGNGSLALGAEDTGEPFCLYGMFLAPETIAYIKKDTTTAEDITLKVTLKGEVEYSKMPVGYLPDEVALKEDIPEGGGGSIDVTAEVGQTIIVKEVDASGKPTKWKAAEYQPRTHWTEVVQGDLVPHTAFTPVYNETFQMLLYGLPYFDLEAGKTYTVIFDGVEYTSTAKAGTIAQMMDTPFVSVGNTALHGVQSAEPFFVAQIPAFNMLAVVCFTADPHTIQIIGEKTVHHKIPEEYASKSDFMIELGFIDGTSYSVNTPWDDIVAAFETRKNIYAVIDGGGIYSNGGGYKERDILHAVQVHIEEEETYEDSYLWFMYFGFGKTSFTTIKFLKITRTHDGEISATLKAAE